MKALLLPAYAGRWLGAACLQHALFAAATGPPNPLLLAAADGLARAAHAALGAAGPLGTVVVEAAVHGVGSPLVFAGAVVAAVAGLVLRMAAVAAAP